MEQPQGAREDPKIAVAGVLKGLEERGHREPAQSNARATTLLGAAAVQSRTPSIPGSI